MRRRWFGLDIEEVIRQLGTQQKNDERLERILIGDLDVVGSRERSILGKLDSDHRRISVLEALAEERKASGYAKRRSAQDWLKEIVAPLASALLTLLVLWAAGKLAR